jgi:hypothetical protein
MVHIFNRNPVLGLAKPVAALAKNPGGFTVLNGKMAA